MNMFRCQVCNGPIDDFQVVNLGNGQSVCSQVCLETGDVQTQASLVELTLSIDVDQDHPDQTSEDYTTCIVVIDLAGEDPSFEL